MKAEKDEMEESLRGGSCSRGENGRTVRGGHFIDLCRKTTEEYVHSKVKTEVLEHQDECMIKVKYESEGVESREKAGSKIVEDGSLQVTKFSTLEVAEDFYMNHARKRGFSVRKDVLRKDSNGICIARRWVCAKEGFRREKWMHRPEQVRHPRGLTRVGCKAAFRVKLNKRSGEWEVKEFNDIHAHYLASATEVHFLPSNRNVELKDIEFAKGLREIGVNTSKAMEYMVSMSNGYGNVGFTKKDLQNKIDAELRPPNDSSDAQRLLDYIQATRDVDPGVYFDYKVDTENRMGDWFWCDSGARADYLVFGDALGFDATYKTNKYRRPLVLFIGINHHRKTTLFGVGMLSDETVETYTWLLTTFMNAMDNRHPQSVITDGDRSMRSAIRKVLPNAVHRLCCWHLHNNAKYNTGDLGFAGKLAKVMGENITVAEFESRWSGIMEDHGLHNNEWVKKLHDDRRLWAEAYLRGNFFGGMRSTQRCETTNAFIKRYVSGKLSMLEVCCQLERALRRMRNNEARDDFHSQYSEPVLETHLVSYEDQARKIFTKTVFTLVREQIAGEAVLIVSDRMSNLQGVVYEITQFQDQKKKWRVVYQQINSQMDCSCKLIESTGIPCSHIFCVMKVEHVQEIPHSMILPRWTKTAKLRSIWPSRNVDQPWEQRKMARVGAMAAACKKMWDFASETDDGYNEAMDCIFRLTMRAQQLIGGLPKSDAQAEGVVRIRQIVKDPPIVKGNGNSRPTVEGKGSQPRKCGHCRKPGHTKTTCRQRDVFGRKGRNSRRGRNYERITEQDSGGQGRENELRGPMMQEPSWLQNMPSFSSYVHGNDRTTYFQQNQQVHVHDFFNR